MNFQKSINAKKQHTNVVIAKINLVNQFCNRVNTVQETVLTVT